MTGPMSASTEPILGSLAREATEQLLNDAANAIEEEHRIPAQRQRAEQQACSDAIQTLCDGISRMAKRLDAYETKRREDAREARRKARADIEASLPDPDDPDAPIHAAVGADPGSDTAWPIRRIRPRRPNASAEAHPANVYFNWRPLDVAR
jgi:hypothetical protein